MEILSKTRSVCPICLKNIEAEIIKNKKEILIHKHCKEHGDFQAVFWRNLPSYEEWINTHAPMKKEIQEKVQAYHDCPHNCGLCENHSQKTCSVLLELCSTCNLHCPVCFADSKAIKDNSAFISLFISLDEIKQKIDFLHSKAGHAILQLSGGEPSLYPHLIEVIKYANPLFSAVQLNTNGILLAENKEFASKLKEAGLSWIFLQFDGTNDSIHKAIRGKKLQEIKLKAIENCKNADLSIVLVCTLVEGINDDNISELLDFALENFPYVRGLHFQPMTLSGRNAFAQKKNHITLPQVIQMLAKQSKGRIHVKDALPSSCEHSLCSFHCRYYVTENQQLEYIHKHKTDCGCDLEKDDAPQRSISTTINSWKNIDKDMSTKRNIDINTSEEKNICKVNAFDEFIARARAKTFSISCMAFQDIHTIDLERLQNCCIHIFDGNDKLIPFCAYNLTSLDGKSLYR